jgi:hypothetical protein
MRIYDNVGSIESLGVKIKQLKGTSIALYIHC